MVLGSFYKIINKNSDIICQHFSLINSVIICNGLVLFLCLLFRIGQCLLHCSFIKEFL